MAEPVLPCFVCGKELESAWKRTVISDEEGGAQQPYGAVTFRAYGQYGSTIFDPVTGARYLEVNLCDECLLERHGRALICFDQRTVTRKALVWEPRTERDG